MNDASKGTGSVARYGWLVGLVAAIALVFAVMGDVGFKAPQPVDAGMTVQSSGGRNLRPAERPDLHIVVMDASPGADAFWTEESFDEERIRRVGLLGHDARWIDDLVKEPDNVWTKVADRGGPTFKDERLGTMVTFKLVDGKVAVVRADFSEGAMSASATALSWMVLGNRMALPFHLEDQVAPDGVLGATETLWDGRVVHWRAGLRTTGEPPYGPAFFEISYAPLAR
jgi:hypothetical protein